MDSRLEYKAGGVSEALFLLQQSKAGLEGVVVEDLEAWEVLAMVCPYEGSQKQPWKQSPERRCWQEQVLAAVEGQVLVALEEGKLVGPWRMERKAFPPWHLPTPSS